MERENVVRRNIEKHGWQFQWVFDPINETESFCYSIGFVELYSHPEIMIFGLEREASRTILSNIANDIKTGITFKPNIKNSEVLSGGFEVMFKEVKNECFAEYLGIALDYYNKQFSAYVMLWPDSSNLLPIEKGCSLKSQSEAVKII